MTTHNGMRALVVGAGVIGASVAYRLARRGARVTVFDRGRPGGGTSATSFAWVNANNKTPRAYHELNVEGMRAHAALRTDFGDVPWWHGGGNARWAVTEASRVRLREHIERLRAWDYPVEEITAGRLRDLEPDIPSEVLRDAEIAYFPEEGWIDTAVYAHTMMEAAVSAGARFHGGAGVRELRRAGNRIVGAVTDDGASHEADVVVNCAGRWADEIGAAGGLRVPLAPTRGLLAITPAAPTRLRRVIHASDCHVRPDGAGRVMVQAEDTDDAVTASAAAQPSPEMAAELVRRAARFLPGLAGMGFEAARIGIRPMPADGHSIVGPRAGLAGYYVVVTHSGVTLAPFLGHVAARELVDGREDPRLAPFRPDRFGTA